MTLMNKSSHPHKHPDQRVGVFIDVQNMYYSGKNLYSAKVNFGAIVKNSIADRKLIRAFAYVISTEGHEEQPFFEALYNLGIETREKQLQIFYGGEKKGDWDVGVTVDAIRLAPMVDTIIIVSGDGDYVPLVEYLKNQGKRVEIVAFGQTTSSKLIDSADDFMDLSEDKAAYLIPQFTRRAPTRSPSQVVKK